MADSKISALPAATTPLAGTEELPVVQSGTTDRVTVANLTAGRSVSGLNFIPTGSSAPTNGMYLPAANTVGVAANSLDVVRFSAAASAVNYLAVQSAAAGSLPSITGAGPTADIGFDLIAKGAGSIRLFSGGGVQFSTANVNSAVNYFEAFGSTSSSPVNLRAAGSGTNLQANIISKGTGAVHLQTNGGTTQFAAVDVNPAPNYLTVGGGTVGNPYIVPAGADSNCSMRISSRGAAAILFHGNSMSGTQFAVNFTGGTIVNYFEATGSASGSSPILRAVGSDTNVSLSYRSKGTGSHIFITGADLTQFEVANVPSAVNYFRVSGAETSNAPHLQATGSDANVSFRYSTKGSGVHNFQTGGGTEVTQFRISHTASAVNYLQVTGAATGAAPSVSAAGTDTNIDLQLTPKGSGNVRFGTYTAGVLAIAGYVEIKDSAGNVRRLAVVA